MVAAGSKSLLAAMNDMRLRMFFFHGFSEKEIADIEGVSQPTVHYSLQSAIRQMRYVLDI